MMSDDKLGDAGLQERFRQCDGGGKRLFVDGEFVRDIRTDEKCYVYPFYCRDDDEVANVAITQFIANAKVFSIRFKSAFQIKATGEYFGQPAIVLGLPKGDLTSLRDLISRCGGWDLESSLELIQSIAVTLHEAHAAGIVVRSVSPDNLFICDKRCFIGILGAAVASGTSRMQSTISDASVERCFPLQQNYVSRDVFAKNSATIETSSDLYSFGVIAREILSYKPSLEGNKGSRRRGISSFIRRCHSSSPSERPRSLQEIIDIIDGYLSPMSTTVQAKQSRFLLAIISFLILWSSCSTWYAFTNGVVGTTSGNAGSNGERATDRPPQFSFNWTLPSRQEVTALLPVTKTQAERARGLFAYTSRNVYVMPTKDPDFVGPAHEDVHPAFHAYRAIHSVPTDLAQVKDVAWFSADTPRFTYSNSQTNMKRVEDEIVRRIEALPAPTSTAIELPGYTRTELFQLLTDGRENYSYDARFVERAWAFQAAAFALSRKGYQVDATRFLGCVVKLLRSIWESEKRYDLKVTVHGSSRMRGADLPFKLASTASQSHW